MFTGLIQEVGSLAAVPSGRGAARFEIEAPGISPSLVKGESVAVNGCCLTVEDHTDRSFKVFASTETLALTTIGGLPRKAPVNLERALQVGDRLGGHLVSGHVDGAGRISSIRSVSPESWEYWFDLPEALAAEVVLKGSIAIDGVSLTVARLEGARFAVAVIPETRAQTTLGRAAEGDAVNIETDMIGKYVIRHLSQMGVSGMRADSLTLDRLIEAGF